MSMCKASRDLVVSRRGQLIGMKRLPWIVPLDNNIALFKGRLATDNMSVTRACIPIPAVFSLPPQAVPRKRF